jgi:hypothetical protein
MSNIGGKVIGREMKYMSLKHLGHNLLGQILLIPSRRNYTLLELYLVGNLIKSTQHLEKEIISDNKPL